jgi:hypothetical protein
MSERKSQSAAAAASSSSESAAAEPVEDEGDDGEERVRRKRKRLKHLSVTANAAGTDAQRSKHAIVEGIKQFLGDKYVLVLPRVLCFQ